MSLVRLMCVSLRERACRHDSSPGAKFVKNCSIGLLKTSFELPPLRARTEDIPELVQCILARNFGVSERRVIFEPRALAALRPYPWPGNLNELEAVVREATAAAEQCGSAETIKLEHLPRLQGAEQHSFHFGS